MPVPGDRQVLVRVEAVGVCGSDVQTAQRAPDWEAWGHEFSGTVVGVGEGTRRVKTGDQVVWVPVLPCGECRRCLAGNTMMCLHMRGHVCQGAAEFYCDDEDSFQGYEGLTHVEAAQAEPLTVALDAVAEAGVSLGDEVLVLGAGPIGLMAARVAQLRGARRVFLADLSDCVAKLELGGRWGCEVVEADRQDLVSAIRAVAPDGVDAAIVTAPPHVLPAAIEACAFGATVAIIGTAYEGAENVTVNVNRFHFSNIRLQGANNCPVLRFPLAFELMKTKAVNVSELVSHRFPLVEAQTAFDANGSCVLDLHFRRPGDGSGGTVAHRDPYV
jgi:L-iditol 2-dehydrogenase